MSATHFRSVLLAVTLAFAVPIGADKGILLIGPTMHWNFGNHQHAFSWGAEASYWNFLGGVWPYGLDAGMEWGGGRFRVYSEAEASVVVVGYALGPVWEWGGGKGVAFGWQQSWWASYILGLEMRWRYLDGVKYRCPGAFLKVPAKYDSAEWDGGDESHHHFHWHD